MSYKHYTKASDIIYLVDKFALLPAIDVQDGFAVRLLQGDIGKKTSYGSPVDVAHEFVATFSAFKSNVGLAGNSQNFWVHLVDLDAAFGKDDNASIIADVTKILSENGVNVELSGGIRDDASLNRALKIGATRINIGTAALENPKWTSNVIGTHGDKIGIGLDVRGEILSARGWTKNGGNIWDMVEKLLKDDVSRLVITDVTMDGTLQGVNVDILKKAASLVQSHGAATKITASGGVSSLDDIATVLQTSVDTCKTVDSVVFGKAIYSGAFTLLEALQFVNERTHNE